MGGASGAGAPQVAAAAAGSQRAGVGREEDLAYINEVIAKECAAALRCHWTEAKGRILTAARPFRRGELILEQPPLLQITAAVGEGEAAEALRRLREERPDELPLEPHWYWLALSSLTQDERGGEGELPGLPPVVPREEQRRLLTLHGGQPGDARVGGLGAQAVVEALGLSKVDPSVLERLVRAWTLNCFEHDERTRTYATYFVPSFLSHSCQPSAVWVLGDDGHFQLRARCDVAQGEEVTISYLSEDGLLDTAPMRQRHLLRSKHFWCTCPRCLPGAPDLSRGFRCPSASCGGAVFCRVLPRQMRSAKPRPKAAKKRSGKRLRLRQVGAGACKPGLEDDLAVLEGAACGKCGGRLAASEAAVLLREERRLRGRLKRWEEQSPRGELELEAVERLERRIERRFAQHVFADRAYGHLVAVCLGLGRRREAERMMERRVSFQGAAYPGASGAHAWTMEAFAQMLLSNRGIKVGDLVERPRSLAATRPLVNGAVAGEAAERVMPLFEKSMDILRVLFGREHEYYTEVEQTALALQTALETVAPGVASASALRAAGAGH